MENSDIIEVFWDSLEPDDTESNSWADLERWELLYDHGFVDPKRLPKERWLEFLKKLPQKEGWYRINRQDLPKFTPFLYKGDIKKPFDPLRLKDGIRPEKWLQEMYQKVLKFETTLKPAEWNQIIVHEIKPRFQAKDDFRFDRRFKEWLVELMATKASPLRKLEVWIHEKSPLETAETSEPPPAAHVPGVQPMDPDRFVASGPEGRKIQKIEKLYYQEESKGNLSDQEVLTFLEELENLEDEEEIPLKDK